MSLDIANSCSSVLSSSAKVSAIEKSLQEGIHNIKELLIDFEQLHIESDSYKKQYIQQKERCDSNSCSSAEALKRIIESKDKIIQLVASTLTRLNETKDLKILDDVFKILFGESLKCSDVKNVTSPIKIKTEVHSSNEDLSFREESVSEIEGTPTGRTSPIIQTKKLKSTLINASDFRDKKKCPDNWPTPEKKALKLSYSTPLKGKQGGKWRQARLNVVAVKESNIIDITSSPEFSGGNRCARSDNDADIKPIIKIESIENDDTILPSPTSGPTGYSLFKNKESPMKFKKPQLSLKTKSENNRTPKKTDPNSNKILVKMEQNSENKFITDVKMNDSVSFTQEDSINLLNPNRLSKNLMKNSPLKKEFLNDETYCDTQASISLLQHVDKLEDIQRGGEVCSPSKRPLAENINIMNIQEDDVIHSSMSLLQREPKNNKVTVENGKRKNPEIVELVFKEPTVRKKADKRLLPGWSCDKCKDFFGELYKDNPELLAKKINECSHHRGINNPTDRPKTPPGFWNPRWEVPQDTEEFNRKNNVD